MGNQIKRMRGLLLVALVALAHAVTDLDDASPLPLGDHEVAPQSLKDFDAVSQKADQLARVAKQNEDKAKQAKAAIEKAKGDIKLKNAETAEKMKTEKQDKVAEEKLKSVQKADEDKAKQLSEKVTAEKAQDELKRAMDVANKDRHVYDDDKGKMADANAKVKMDVANVKQADDKVIDDHKKAQKAVADAKKWEQETAKSVGKILPDHPIPCDSCPDSGDP